MEIREFNNEFAQLADFWNECEPLFPGTRNMGIILQERDASEWYGTRDIIKAFGAWENGKLAGFISLIPSNKGNGLLLDWICVLPKYEKRLLSLQLVQSIMEFLNDGKFDFFEGITWPSNHSIKFSKKLGMKWISKTAVNYINYLPLISRNAACNDFLEVSDQHSLLSHVVKYHIPSDEPYDDAVMFEGKRVYEYHFERDRETMKVRIDPETHSICSITGPNGEASISAEYLQHSQQLKVSGNIPDGCSHVAIESSVLEGAGKAEICGNQWQAFLPLQDCSDERVLVKAEFFLFDDRRPVSLMTSYNFDRSVVQEWLFPGGNVVEQSENYIITYGEDKRILVARKGGSLQIHSLGAPQVSIAPLELGPKFYPSKLTNKRFTLQRLETLEKSVRVSFLTEIHIGEKIQTIILQLEIEADTIAVHYSGKDLEGAIRVIPTVNRKEGTLYYELEGRIVKGDIAMGMYPIAIDLRSDAALYTSSWCAFVDESSRIDFRWSHAENVNFQYNRFPQLTAPVQDKPLTLLLDYRARKERGLEKAKPYLSVDFDYKFNQATIECKVLIQTILKRGRSGTVRLVQTNDFDCMEPEKTFVNLSYENDVETSFFVVPTHYRNHYTLTFELEVQGIVYIEEYTVSRGYPDLNAAFKYHPSSGNLIDLTINGIPLVASTDTFGPYAPWLGGIHPEVTETSASWMNLVDSASKKITNRHDGREVLYAIRNHPNLYVKLSYIIGNSEISCISTLVSDLPEQNIERLNHRIRFQLHPDIKRISAERGGVRSIFLARPEQLMYYADQFEVDARDAVLKMLPSESCRLYLEQYGEMERSINVAGSIQGEEIGFRMFLTNRDL